MRGGTYIFLAIAATLAASQTHAKDRLYFEPHYGTLLREADLVPSSAAKSATLIETLTSTSIQFRMMYMDTDGVGWLDAELGPTRRATLDAVLVYIDSILDHEGECWIELFGVAPAGSNFLGAAGAYFFEEDGFQGGAAFEAITLGRDPEVATPDMRITINFSPAFNNSLNPPASNQADLYSILLHEVTHGLGFASLSSPTGASRAADFGFTIFTLYDQMLFDRVANLPAFLPDLTWQGASFTGGNNTVDAGGSNVEFIFGSRPPVYTPATFAQGSSISHWQFTAPIPSTSVMRHAMSSGQMRRVYLPFEIAMLQDLGYTIKQDTRVPSETWLLE